MRWSRVALYLAGLAGVVAAAWRFLTHQASGEGMPPGVGRALILLLLGIGLMASAQSMERSASRTARTKRRHI